MKPFICLSMRARRFLLPVLSLALSGCIFSGNNADEAVCELAVGEAFCRAGPKSCVSITGGSTTTQFNANNCSNCTVSEAPKAIDGDRASFATLSLPAASLGSAALRAVAQTGTVFPAGRVAAAVLTPGPPNNRLRVTTYLGGTLQETGRLSSVTQEGVEIIGFKTSQQFDAVEFTVVGRGTTGDTAAESVQVREFCSDGVVNPFGN